MIDLGAMANSAQLKPIPSDRQIGREREEDWQSREAVLEDLCSLCGQVRAYLDRTESTAADCFCPNSLSEITGQWCFSPRVMDFIWDAVRDRIGSETQNTDPAPVEPDPASEPGDA